MDNVQPTTQTQSIIIDKSSLMNAIENIDFYANAFDSMYIVLSHLRDFGRNYQDFEVEALVNLLSIACLSCKEKIDIASGTLNKSIQQQK